MRKRPIVGVMGSGSLSHDAAASELGSFLATRAVHLLTGGGGGVMTSVSKAFSLCKPRLGCVIGVLPCASQEQPTMPKPGYPNDWIEIPIHTHLPLSGLQGRDLASRNHINVLSSDVVISLPGSEGTRSEIDLALDYGRPVIAYLPHDLEFPKLPSKVSVATDLPSLERFLDEHLPQPQDGQ